MKKMQLINDDFTGRIEHIRDACRGLLVNDGKILLTYEINNDRYMIPGGGVEEGEMLEECCERELLEETGMKVKVIDNYLEIEELYDTWRHTQHFFICELIEDTGEVHLTEAEEEAGYKSVWMPVEEALELFGRFETFRSWNIPDYGLYRREYIAIKEYANKQ